MTDNKTGPVKPPVIDLSANSDPKASPKPAGKSEAPAATKSGSDQSAIGPTKPETRPDAKNDDSAKSKPSARSDAASAASARSTSATTPSATNAPRRDNGVLVTGIIGGGVLGLAAAYGPAWAGLWPTIAVTDPTLDELRANAGAITETVTATPELRQAVAELLDNSGALTADVAALTAETTALREDIDSMPTTSADGTIDLTPFETRLSALEDGASADDGVAGLTEQVVALETLVETQASEIERLSGAVSATETALSGQPADLGAAVQLPLILGGLEAAFSAGQPFLSELDALRRTVPQIEVSPVLLETAGTGLPEPQAILAEFETVLPAMLSGRPGDPDAAWQDATFDWFRNVLALRPANEMSGDDPVAVVSRLEAAMARRDFLAADELFALLPVEMSDAAGTVPDMVAMHADAVRLIETIRRAALENSALTAGSAS